MATTTPVPERTRSRPSSEMCRLGYSAVIVLTVAGLYVAHQLVDWGWPRFLTAEFEDVLPIVTISFLVSIVVNAVYLFDDSPRIKSGGEIVEALAGFAAAVRIWQVFPFDFSTYAHDWSWLVRLVLVVAIVGTLIGTIVETVRLIRGPAPDGEPSGPEPAEHPTM